MSRIAKEFYIDALGVVLVILVSSVIMSTLLDYPYLSLIASIDLVLGTLFLIATSNKEKMAIKLCSYLGSEMEPGDMNMDLEAFDESDQGGSLKQQAARGIVSHFPTGFFLFLFLSVTVVLFFDITTGNSVPNQAYGLLFDGVGGVLLALDSFANMVGVNVLPSNTAGRASEGFWGVPFTWHGLFPSICRSYNSVMYVWPLSDICNKSLYTFYFTSSLSRQY